MIYSHKNDTLKRNLSPVEKMKLKQLQKTKPTAWMIDARTAIN